MEPEQWQQAELLYHAAIDCPEDKRSELLDRGCAGDAELRAEIESLLEHGLRSSDFLEKPAFEVLALELARDLSFEDGARTGRMIGARIGPYRILERLGAGGMGDVFRATRADDQYEKQVAIKLVRQELNTDSINAHFLKERQILAGFEHENVARLLDGGATAEGQPYFVMELVEGKLIDEYCDDHMLGIAARLELFRCVCSAVQYAHRRLVVHRDIKPSNILVTAEGVPKLLDFGIATILSPEMFSPVAERTETALRILTPQYASPEQLRGEAITTATDVYSLGVVLYKLLTGLMPYRLESSSRYELTKAICDMEPEKPSAAIGRSSPVRQRNEAGPEATPELAAKCRNTTPEKLRRTLAGDLDQIVLKALRKEPERRYASAQAFADDLRLFALGLPVSALGDTFAYRSGKFIKRHRLALAVAAAFLLMALAGVGAVLREAQIAREQQARAERRFNDVRGLANSLLFEVYDSIRNLPGSTAARRVIADRALHYLDSLAQESAGVPDLQSELATAYERVGDVQGNPYFANLGDTAGAIESYRKALHIRLELAGNNPQTKTDKSALVGTYMQLGLALGATGNYAAAMNAYRSAYPIAQALAIEDKDDPKAQEALAGTSFSIAMTLADMGDIAGSLDFYRRSASIRESITGGSKDFREEVQTRLAGVYGYMAGDVSQHGDAETAVKLENKAHAILAAQLKSDPQNAAIQQFLLESDYWSGYYSAQRGDYQSAISSYREALSGYRGLSSADPHDTLAKRYLGLCHMSMGIALAESGNAAQGILHIRQAVQIFLSLATPDRDNNSFNSIDLAYARATLGEAYEHLAEKPGASGAARISDWSAARSWYRQSLESWLVLKKKAPLGQSDASQPDRIAHEIARCDASLARN
ncbi:MAG: serine/threonine-protein kinase [Terracidiphilus sp.]|jgi:non-specific serine/threonine protein kinase/serine/threonine-protein kinase